MGRVMGRMMMMGETGYDCYDETSSSCVGSCGFQSPGVCWCDDLCVEYGDCCEDACDECGHCYSVMSELGNDSYDDLDRRLTMNNKRKIIQFYFFPVTIRVPDQESFFPYCQDLMFLNPDLLKIEIHSLLCSNVIVEIPQSFCQLKLGLFSL